LPTFDFLCNKCAAEWEAVMSMRESVCPRCPKCDSRDTMKVFNVAPAVKCPDMFWEFEGNGRGRYISQLATKLNDPNAYCRSRQEAKAKAKARGMRVSDA
jgi:putative FmdB family regulatory protein